MENVTKEMFDKLQEAEQKLVSMETDHQTSLPKIQKVPHHLIGRKKFAKYYSPKLVSFGPIHHGKAHLQRGEQYKHMWASLYLQRTKKCREELHAKIREEIKTLKDLYRKDAIGDFNDEKLSAILFVDGCSLLQILHKFDFFKPGDLKIKVDQLPLVQRDVLLLENQLPFQLLQILTDNMDAKEDMAKFINYSDIISLPITEAAMRKCCCIICIKHESNEHEEFAKQPRSPLAPPHLLHQLRDFLLVNFPPNNGDSEHGSRGDSKRRSRRRYRNIKELKEAGIRVKRSKSLCPIDIKFQSTWFGGRLELPNIVVDNTIAPIWLNLIPYEMCPDFQNKCEISSFVEFLDSLIDYPEDVKELRAAGVLRNSLGSDNEAAELFNIISSDSVATSTFASVRCEIEKYYEKKCNIWFAQAYHTYFKSPWTIIAFLAAFLALLFTAVQTWFVVFPPKSISK